MAKLSPYFTGVACQQCGHTMPPSLTRAKCERCGSPWLEAQYDYQAVAALWPDALAGRGKTMWRYQELLPVVPEARISMDEGWTPLLKAKELGHQLEHSRLYIKDERQSPTSSFKDRQAALTISALKAARIKECVIASTGNASTAYAAYCARAGIKLWVFVTSLVPAEKMREAALYGAEVIKITGTYDQTKAIAADFAKRRGLYFDTGAKGIVGKESMKTIAFEIVEQLGWRAPDWYIQSVSGGIGPIGVWKGFVELKRMGLIKKLPRLAIIQSEGCDPMARAFEADRETAEPVTPRTAITILSTGDPGFAYTLLYRAAKSNGGVITSVPDRDAFRALRRLARAEGMSVEPATGVAFAGLEALLTENVIKPRHTVVVNASGHTLPVEKFVIEDQAIVDIDVNSKLAEQWGMREEGLSAALEHLDEKITRVVVIDDSPHDSRLIRRLLQRHRSYRVFEANEGKTGLELVRERRPDLIILDLMMPDMDGFDVLSALKADPQTARIPVIVVSGKTLTTQERERLQDQTVSVWLKGSYSTHDLVDHIVRQLGEPGVSAAVTPDASGTPEGKRRPAVLVIDDSPLDARLVRRTLESRGMYRVLEARSGEQALAMIEADTPDLIILDLMLPGMDGFQILERLRSNPAARDLPVVVLSAKELTPEEQARLAKGRVESTWAKGATDRAALQEHIVKVIEEV